MEKAIEIKRRAQRCIQNGDLDGALREYEKLVSGEDADPYNHVLLADLLYRKGEQIDAAERYLAAVTAYERASLFKNAIAVCKKMLRLSLSPAKVLKHLAQLHALDGLAGEASLYHVQYAEQMVRSNEPAEAAAALRAAFDVCQDNIRILEQLAEAHLMMGEDVEAARTLQEAGAHYRSVGQEAEALRVLERAAQIDPAGRSAAPAAATAPAAPAAPVREVSHDEPRGLELDPKYQSMFTASGRMEDLETGRHTSLPPLPLGEPADAHERAAEEPAFAAPEAAEPAAEWDPAEAPTLRSPGAPMSFEKPDAEPVAEAVEPEPVADAAPAFTLEARAPEPEVPTFTLEADASEPEAPETGPMVFEIDASEDEAETPLSVAFEPGFAAAEPEPEAGVYEIEAEDVPEPSMARAPEPAGLAFESPAAASPDPLSRVESLLSTAQEQFRAGEREAASATLMAAAQAYESLGRLDSAATIYRSLGRGAQATAELMMLWMANCEARGDAAEAAQVACEIGDRALNDGEAARAHEWFERAKALDPANETARRRLSRLDGESPTAALPALPPAPAMEPGRVEVAVGRAEAVTFDLSGLLAEFQRGVEAQLSGDAQSHYDLGMTYREMGLVEQAVESFRISEMDPGLTARSLEMVGRCFADMGRWAEATFEFGRALALPGLDEVAMAELRYHQGIALVHAGETMMALQEFEKVAGVLEGYEDVDERIASLRDQLGKAA